MIDYDEGWRLLVSRDGSVVPVAMLRALPTAVIAVILLLLEDYQQDLPWGVEDYRAEFGLTNVNQSFMWTAVTATIATLLSFRTNQAFKRFWEGTSLLHQMRGEWFDSASCLMTFSRDAFCNKGKIDEVREFRHTLLRLMSLMHASALAEISAESETGYDVLDIHGLDSETLKFLRNCKANGFNRVEALQHMIQVLVTHNHHNGVLTIPPPILSRVYQTLSRGLVNLLNARKIKDTMFPFPYAQIIYVLLLAQVFFTPLIVTQHIQTKVVAAFVSFLPLFGMYSLNAIAGELEMPFGTDDNDLPMAHFQHEMNEALLMLIHDMSDHVPHTSYSAVKNFEQLETFLHWVDDTGHTSDSSSFLEPDFFEEVDRDTQPTPHKSPGKIIDVPMSVPSPTKPPLALPLPPPTQMPRTPPQDSKLGVFFAPREGEPKKEAEAAKASPPAPAAAPPPAKAAAPVPEAAKPAAPPGPDMAKLYNDWIAKTDLQVQEMKKNTEQMTAFVSTFPKTLADQSYAFIGLTEAVLRTVAVAPGGAKGDLNGNGYAEHDNNGGGAHGDPKIDESIRGAILQAEEFRKRNAGEAKTGL
eukprot:TRINITY_DN2491_c1_g2_i1.p1 TRINITY_DN2491_c1_g2~~TRINITY_DN2491_c1_g2_i1.p1  ORF type:complete len:583 (+),score=133.26 TRINITY_DN2491_c1_g2_i1:90-1838(+)